MNENEKKHSELDINYHNIIASEYESVVNEPRRLSNDILFQPLLDQIPYKIDNYLDLGCGTGQMIDRVGRRFRPKEIWGVDHSPAMLAKSKACASNLSINKFHAINEDVFNFLQNSSRTYSLISAVGVIHHLQPAKVPLLLELCYQSLSDNGLLLLAEPVDVEALYKVPALVDKWNSKSAFKGRDYSQSAEEPDEHPLKEGWLEQQLEAANFKTVKTNRGIELFPRNNPPSFIDKFAIKSLQKIYGRKGFVSAWLLKKI